MQEGMAAAVPSLKCRTLKYASELGTDVSKTTDFSVLQYNVLADSAIPRGDQGANFCGHYFYCPKEYRYMDSE